MFLDALELSDRSPHTLAVYGRSLEELSGCVSDNSKPLALEDIESSHVRGLLLHLSRRRKKPGHRHRTTPATGLSRETLRGYHRVLSAFFEWCECQGLLSGHRPMHNAPRPKPEREEMPLLSDDGIRRVPALLDKPSPERSTSSVACSWTRRSMPAWTSCSRTPTPLCLKEPPTWCVDDIVSQGGQEKV